MKWCRGWIITHIAENPKGEQEFERALDRSCVSGTVQVITSHSWTGVGVLKKKPKLCSSLPAPVWSQVDTMLEAEFAFTAASVPSGSPSNQTDCVKVFCFHHRRIHSWRALWTRPSRTQRGGGEWTVRTYASVFGLWLLLPQNKYVLKGRVFTDITPYQRLQAAFELGQVKNSLGSLPPGRSTRSALRNSAFLKQQHSPRPCPTDFLKTREKSAGFPCKGQSYLECMNGHIWYL